ncbi:MAG: hypothetical protein GX639_09765 [Fibrobacter sp.]|nr:hypothetical protein [Fibrobacter sp.]
MRIHFTAFIISMLVSLSFSEQSYLKKEYEKYGELQVISCIGLASCIAVDILGINKYNSKPEIKYSKTTVFNDTTTHKTKDYSQKILGKKILYVCIPLTVFTTYTTIKCTYNKNRFKRMYLKASSNSVSFHYVF